MFATKYQCFCTDCNHTFFSNEIPVEKRRGLLKRILPPQPIKTSDAPSPKHSALAVSVTADDYKSTVRCPNCGGQHVTLSAVVN